MLLGWKDRGYWRLFATLPTAGSGWHRMLAGAILFVASACIGAATAGQLTAQVVPSQAALPRGVREAAARQPPVTASSLPTNPATTTTTTPNTSASQSATAGSPVPATTAAQTPTRLDLEIVSGELTLDAANVSLNQILRQIVAKTGLKITGGVADQAVYGRYGPGPVGTVIAALLDGTGTNMLLVNGANGPSELILTPRQGGPSPPGPMAAEPQPYNNYAERQGRGGFLGARADGNVAVAPLSYQPPPQANQEQNIAPATEPTAPPANGEGVNNGQSPNGTKTPLQIYQELQQLRQNPPPAPATPPQ